MPTPVEVALLPGSTSTAPKPFEDATMRIKQLNTATSARLRMIDADATIHAAAHSLSTPGIGLVIVCGYGGKLAGVLSKSDLIRHLASRETLASIEALMSRNVVSCTPDDDVHAVWQIMAAQGLKNVPVLDTGTLPIGILEIGDAMKALFEQEELQEHMLTNYIAGVGYR
jgi:CBS domain-containing protein